MKTYGYGSRVCNKIFKRASFQRTTIGLYDENNDNVYVKLDGTPLTFTNWRPGYPKSEPNRESRCVYSNAPTYQFGVPQPGYMNYWVNDLCGNGATCYVCQSSKLIQITNY